MSTYVIGDIQGCYNELQRLLEKIHFDPSQDYLWCTGDLVNRGPHSLEVLRFFKQLGSRAITVLGNHDLHLLVVAYVGNHYLKSKDTLTTILQAPDRDELLHWLRHRPFLHHDSNSGYTLIHAGLPPQWDLAQARQYAQEVENTLRGQHFPRYLTNLYGDKPQQWSNELQGWDRQRFITNCFTRLRYCDAHGKLAMRNKNTPNLDNDQSKERPWFSWSHRASRQMRIVFGHWSTLGYYTNGEVYALDTGCVWGGALTALCLENQQVTNISCPKTCAPGDE